MGVGVSMVAARIHRSLRFQQLFVHHRYQKITERCSYLLNVRGSISPTPIWGLETDTVVRQAGFLMNYDWVSDNYTEWDCLSVKIAKSSEMYDMGR